VVVSPIQLERHMQEECKVRRCIPCKGGEDGVDGLVPFRGRHTGVIIVVLFYIYQTYIFCNFHEIHFGTTKKLSFVKMCVN
jgi:hypothetical protein